jgi:prepilin-type N-terminal cleavage/methylation domain-containing protein
MDPDSHSRGRVASSKASNRGMTIMELLIVVVILSLLVTLIGFRVKPTLERTDAANAAATVALDLEQAVSLATRQRRPVRVSCDCPTRTYTLTDRGTGTVLFRRVLGTAVVLSADPVDVFPSGLTSSALTITVGTAPVTRQVTMSTGGFVRLVR